MSDKFVGCSFIKRPWVRPTMVWRRRLPHCKRTPVAKSWQIREHFSRIWRFPLWKSCNGLLWETTRGKWHRQYFCGARNFWSWGCYFGYGKWKLYTWETWNSIHIRSSSTPSVFWIYKNLQFQFQSRFSKLFVHTLLQSYKHHLEQKIEPLKVLNQLGNAIKMKLMNLVKQFHYL